MGEDKITVALDAMGGDHAPFEIVKGAAIAVNEMAGMKVLLTGRTEEIEKCLAKLKEEGINPDRSRLEIVEANDIISNEDAPVMAVRRKKDSSLVVAMKLVKEGKADAFISAGSTGAVLVGGQLIIGRLHGIERSPLGAMVPTVNGMSLILDCGANVDSRASHLVQYAKMGSLYMEHVLNIKSPRVAILNIGAEEEKGNALVKETFPLLKNRSDINFTGSVEARQIAFGDADVIVCDAFAGNCVLKMYEGVAQVFMGKMKEAIYSNTRSKIGGALLKPAIKKTLGAFDTKQYGGAPMLGLNELVVKAHGSSKAVEITSALRQCMTFKSQHIGDFIKEYLAKEYQAIP